MLFDIISVSKTDTSNPFFQHGLTSIQEPLKFMNA